MYTLNITKAIKKRCQSKKSETFFENYYKQIGFSKKNTYYKMKHLKRKDLSLLANKLIEKIPDPRNAKITINHL